MRVLVTGGAGFIGSNFTKHAINGAFSEITAVTVLDKLTYAGVRSNLSELEKYANFQFVEGDICDGDTVRDLVSSVDAVINFAAESHVDRSITDAQQFITTNVGGVQILLDAIKSTGSKKRFIQVSTDEVYGSIDSGSWDEQSPLLPNSPYSASKAGGELLAMAYHRTFGTDVVITRCSNNYGTHHFPEKLIPLFVTNLLEGKKIPVYGNGLNVRDWLHVDDHCRAIYKVLLGGRAGQVYNIGGGRELSNIEISKMILSAIGEDESRIEFVEDRKGHDFRYSVNWSKINQELGYEPEVDFETGLDATIDWYRNNRKWWEPLKYPDGK
ncbi:unannotated protein [freshwater metagenome]|uniref:Unannotated protein n=1 Tax=freshwater metagenome TaxID=449393 RepID=A0A6J6PKY4_9ZZZZ|nr:dTDP-glucose 4,6-dehydratase [Actinomycetota bacterium]MSX45099.1 dTDP-glucose 4,6-dehydratase [Actinomycetota bacterium]MSX73070.1 dTDP-glucose 4,6-dehydratase [Actinomycetota bacterium]MSZ00780.1 dTDP-glucose 4,6-dehydratase [Actinomycetota bacterium]MTB20384.1 dTDP-glucose 4,6-dehydratase [Actinomycetota bacterium]